MICTPESFILEKEGNIRILYFLLNYFNNSYLLKCILIAVYGYLDCFIMVFFLLGESKSVSQIRYTDHNSNKI
jgi:hypothetical protein